MDRLEMLNMPQDLNDDFLKHQLDLEVKRRSTPYDLIDQPNFQPWQRTNIIQWIESVVTVYSCSRESLFLAVNLLDRYLAQCTLHKHELFLVGIASLLIALKYAETQETHPNLVDFTELSKGTFSPKQLLFLFRKYTETQETHPSVIDFSKLSKGTLSPKQIIDMEEKILRALEFEVGAPTANFFVSYWAKEAGAPSEVKELALAFCEFSLIPSCFGVYRPSVVAASAIHLASSLTGFVIARCPTLKLLTKDSDREVKDCTADFVNICIPLTVTDKQERKKISLVFAPTYLPFFDRRDTTISVDGSVNTGQDTRISMSYLEDVTFNLNL